ncbi:hypothetical protein UVI_02033470 [Ustilaginoidea virens]|uniref:Uncharacterized protein n=1 Tax=Ustilaginoidea virens TaxID=1159556 RepID=A0A1B5L2Q0_USTVR|nr:hypothetical protein UVI_02033470 [Ustilaginoidea virens]
MAFVDSAGFEGRGSDFWNNHCCVSPLQDGIHNVHNGLPIHVDIFGIFEAGRLEAARFSRGFEKSCGQLEDADGFIIELFRNVGVYCSLKVQVFCSDAIDGFDGGD